MRVFHNQAQYSYSSDELRRCLRAEDVWHYNLDSTTLKQVTEEISEAFYTTGSAVRHLQRVPLRGKYLYPPTNIYDTLCLRRTDQLLRDALSTTIVHRDDEIRQLLVTLQGEGPTNILRADIRSFFESIDFGQLIDKLEANDFRNTAVVKHLREINRYLKLTYEGYAGLPRGIGISSTLADFMLRDLDNRIEFHEGVTYYSRYVDDICIVHSLPFEDLLQQVLGALPPGLTLNNEKTGAFATAKGGQMEYIGYSIDVANCKKVGIARKKIEKSKKRIALSFVKFCQRPDFTLLRDRLRFLMCITEMRMHRRSVPVLCGFRHTYRRCSEVEIIVQLRELDDFYFGLLKSKRYSLAKKVRQILGTSEWNELMRMSFVSAYRAKVTHKLSQVRIAAIKSAWAHA